MLLRVTETCTENQEWLKIVLSSALSDGKVKENGDNDGMLGAVWMWDQPKLRQKIKSTDGF